MFVHYLVVSIGDPECLADPASYSHQTGSPLRVAADVAAALSTFTAAITETVRQLGNRKLPWANSTSWHLDGPTWSFHSRDVPFHLERAR